jgi:hypothetical protein
MPLLSPAAAGLITPAFDGVVYLIAQSATFRGVVAAVDADDALNHIALYEARDEEDPSAPADERNTIDARPRAIVNIPHNWGREANGQGNWHPTGEILIAFEFLIPSPYRVPPGTDWGLECRWFLNQIGAIAQEITDAAGLSDGGSPPRLYAAITKFIVQSWGPCLDTQEVEHFWGANINVGWPG